MGGPEPYQGAVCRQSPKRKVGAIAVISEVEHARKPRRGEARITPQTVVLLGSQQVFDTAPHRIGADLPGRKQPQQGPGTLVGSARRFSGCLLPVRVGVIALAPAAVGILPGYEPTHGAARGRIIRADARLRERSQYRPGTVDVVRAPATEPRAVRFLLLAQKGDCASEHRLVLGTPDLRQHRHHAGGDIARGRIQQSAMIRDWNLVEVVMGVVDVERSEEHTSELQSQSNLVCRLLLEKKRANVAAGASASRQHGDGDGRYLRLRGAAHGTGGSRRRTHSRGAGVVTAPCDPCRYTGAAH